MKCMNYGYIFHPWLFILVNHIILGLGRGPSYLHCRLLSYQAQGMYFSIVKNIVIVNNNEELGF